MDKETIANTIGFIGLGVMGVADSLGDIAKNRGAIFISMPGGI